MPGISKILEGGIVAGLTAAFVTKGFEVVQEGMSKIVETVAEGVKDAAEEILKIGEAWEQVDRQLSLTDNGFRCGSGFVEAVRGQHSSQRSWYVNQRSGFDDWGAELAARPDR